MILLVLLVLVLGGAAAAVLLGVGLTGGSRRQPGADVVAGLSLPAVAGAVAVVALVLVVGLGVVGVDGGGGGSEEAPALDERSSATLPNARLGTTSATLPVVRIQPAQDDAFTRYEPVGALVPGAAVRVRADDFGWTQGGHVEQCVLELGRQTVCGEPFPVHFDDGRADFQLAVRDEIAPGRCRAGQATCLLQLTAEDSGTSGATQIVFVDQVSPGDIQVEPAQGLAAGDTVEVSVTGFPAGASASAVLCAPPAAYDARRCMPHNSATTFVIDAGGGGRTRLVVTPGRLGPDQVTCGPRRPCGVQVLVGDGFVAAPVAPVTFSAGPGPAYDAGRLAGGAAVAVVLAGIAVAIARRTDWTKPSEAATPDLDAADLHTDQGLDELFGTDAELDERDPIPWS